MRGLAELTMFLIQASVDQVPALFRFFLWLAKTRKQRTRPHQDTITMEQCEIVMDITWIFQVSANARQHGSVRSGA
jgi:hypothetical protein